jgi:hypothetical protein
MGQHAEIPYDVVFTVEYRCDQRRWRYSVCSASTGKFFLLQGPAQSAHLFDALKMVHRK